MAFRLEVGLQLCSSFFGREDFFMRGNTDARLTLSGDGSDISIVSLDYYHRQYALMFV